MDRTGLTIHMSTSIEGLLRHYKRKKITFLTDDEGNLISDSEARRELKQMLADGQKLIKSSGCSKFDPIKGCLGHTAEELRQEEITKLNARLAELGVGNG